MRHKMDIGKLFWTAGEIRFRSRLLAREYPLLGRREMSGNAFHLGCGFWEFGIFIVRCKDVADEKQPAGPFLGFLAFGRPRRARGPERAAIPNRRVLNPIVQVSLGQHWPPNDESLEI